MTKIKRAVQYLDAHPGMTQYRAALDCGVSQPALSLALSKRRADVEHYLAHRDAIDSGQYGAMSTESITRAFRGRNAYHGEHLPDAAPQLSATAQALDWYAAQGGSQAAAADRFDIRPSGFCAALRLERARGVSPEAQARRDAMRPIDPTERAARIALELCGPGLGDVVAAAIRAANTQPDEH